MQVGSRFVAVDSNAMYRPFAVTGLAARAVGLHETGAETRARCRSRIEVAHEDVGQVGGVAGDEVRRVLDTNATTFPLPLIDGFRLLALAGKSIPTIVATLSLITSPVP